MNTTKIKAAALGMLLAAVPLADAMAHSSTPTPTIEERLTEKCAEKQVKAIGRYQGCLFASYIRARLKGYTVGQLTASNQKCTDKIISSLQQTDEKYGSFCAINFQGIQQDLSNYINGQVLCVVQYVLDGNDSCYP